MKEVSMYYANLTNIDLAMFMPDGRLRGDSFNLHVKMTGQEDPEEAVLIDFSTAKKTIKSWIDDHVGNGFDHKCWVTLHPDIDIQVQGDNEVQFPQDGQMVSVLSAPSRSMVTLLKAKANKN